MKKAFLLIVACTFAFLSTNAQSSQVETVSQTTKTEQFKTNCSFLKESIIGEFKEGGVRILTIVYTDLKTGKELVGMEFQSYGTLLNGIKTPENLGYLDFEQIDDLLFALEKILEESKSNDKKDKCAIHYTTASGIDVHYYSIKGMQLVGFRKKWLAKNEFGVPYYTYTETPPTMGIGKLSDLISEIKESQVIAKQYQNK
jgi:hypothetical protein